MSRVCRQYRAIGEASGGLPLFVYNLPSSTGTTLTPGLMKRIKEGVPSLKGLKHSASDSQVGLVSAYVGMGLTCFIGNGRLCLPAMIMGAQGCIDGPPCMAPEPWVELYATIIAGDIEKAKKLQQRCADISSLVITPHGYEQPAVQKAVLTARLGIDCGAPRLPTLPLKPETLASVLKGATELGLGPVKVEGMSSARL